ncbi:hypothetical protein [Cellvibrio fontiphilus]|uniref:Uncharacterized protein n=1 Tax=Cellvibrio fontiphilus TaxID=1815559 RepID=A0ABV7FDV7_9GAMM
MQYTKPMVDLVYEIRRRVDAAMKPGVKMANPELLKELADYHHHSKDTITKALIKELLFMAGPPWATLLEPAQPDNKDLPRQVVKVYRGQTVLEEASHEPAVAEPDVVRSEILSPIAPAVEKPVRMYRGQPIL